MGGMLSSERKKRLRDWHYGAVIAGIIALLAGSAAWHQIDAFRKQLGGDLPLGIVLAIVAIICVAIFLVSVRNAWNISVEIEQGKEK